MERFICLNPKCEAVFDEDEIVTAVIDRHPYQEGWANEYGCVCPRCHSAEIALAVECSICGRTVSDDEKRYDPMTDEPVCEDCYEDRQAYVEAMYLEEERNGTR